MLRRPVSLFVLSLVVAGCASSGDRHADRHARSAAIAHPALMADRAVAVLVPTAGNSAHGTVQFFEHAGSVVITADIRGLDPGGTHAWHIHEYGDLRSDDGTATGSHYNPEGHPHGLPYDDHRHAGDFGNLRADQDGRAVVNMTVTNITILGARNPIAGRAIIVHAQPDDGGQPTGNAGARIAQGVIGITNR